MSSYFDRFKKRMNLTGGSIREDTIFNNRKLIELSFADDAAYQKGIVFFWKLGLETYEGENAIPIRFFDRKFSEANGEMMKFQTPYYVPIVVGDVLYDSKENEYWICEQSFNIDDINYSGKLMKCNWMLKWQTVNGDIVTYPCQDMNATQYNSGERSNQMYTIGSSQHMLTLPCDENTLLLDTPQRFYLDKNIKQPTTYRVTQNDTTSYNYGKGLCKVTVTECPENLETDNRELGVCDYFTITDTKNVTSGVQAKIEYSAATIKSGGKNQVFTAVFTDENGAVLDIDANWSIVCDFINELEVKESGNTISIGIDNDDYIDEEFKLVLSSESEAETSLIIHIGSLL